MATKKTNSKKKILTEDTFNANGNNVVESEGVVLAESTEEKDESDVKEETKEEVIEESEIIKEEITPVDEVKESINDEDVSLDDISEVIEETKEDIKDEIKNDAEIKAKTTKVITKGKKKIFGSHDENFYM